VVSILGPVVEGVLIVAHGRRATRPHEAAGDRSDTTNVRGPWPGNEAVHGVHDPQVETPSARADTR
jgi:hypothetical protein